jgi:REP element-mobilizing transposase RayT
MPYRDFNFERGGFYHVYNRGVNCELVFFDRENYLYFTRLLKQHVASQGVDLVAYCLMPSHYHLVARIDTEDFSGLMQSFGLAYTKAIDKRLGRVGSLFQGRFKAIHVDREEHLLHLSCYVHLNPWTAGLVTRVEDWEFSSYPEYIGMRRGTLPKPGVVLSQFPTPEAYRAFLEAGAGGESRKIDHLMLDCDVNTALRRERDSRPNLRQKPVFEEENGLEASRWNPTPPPTPRRGSARERSRPR